MLIPEDYFFKIDPQGNTVFFPDGVWKQGYIIPDQATKDAILPVCARYGTIFTISFILAIGSNYYIFAAYLISLLLLKKFWFLRKIRRIAPNLMPSDYAPKPSYYKMAGVALLAVAAFSFIWSIGLFKAAACAGPKGIIIGLVAFFTTITLLIVAAAICFKKDKQLKVANKDGRVAE